MSMHTIDAVEAARAKIAAAVARAEHEPTRIHIGTANTKTDAINEGTAPLVTCCGHACVTCGRECYAVWHMALPYPRVMETRAANTVARRRDPKAYYARFFAACVAYDIKLLRVNESGDFETCDQVLELFKAAMMHPDIEVIGYTRRPNLAALLPCAPQNVHLRYSLYRDRDEDGTACRRSLLAAVSDRETTCPAQIAQSNGRRWTCADCARHGCGCASDRAVIIFRAH